LCKSFADAAVSMLESSRRRSWPPPNVDLSSGGIRGVYGLSLGIAGLVAVILLLMQIARTAITHDGDALAQGVLGIGKAAVAFMLTLTVAGTALVAADELSAFIIARTFGSADGLQHKLTNVFKWAPQTTPSLLLIMAIVGILLVTVLWFELLLRNAAVAVLIAPSPISATGMLSQSTREWWPKLAAGTIRLVVLKPAIALVFAVGFGVTGGSQSEDLGTLLAGMLILLLAVLAWPAIGRLFTFMTVHTGGGSGLAAVLGFAANQVNGGGGGGAPVGVNPDQFGQAAESRTMSSFAARTGGAESATAGPAAARAPVRCRWRGCGGGAARGDPAGAGPWPGHGSGRPTAWSVAWSRLPGTPACRGRRRSPTQPGTPAGSRPASAGSPRTAAHPRPQPTLAISQPEERCPRLGPRPARPVDSRCPPRPATGLQRQALPPLRWLADPGQRGRAQDTAAAGQAGGPSASSRPPTDPSRRTANHCRTGGTGDAARRAGGHGTPGW
jgi:hypothetical protein